MPELHFRLSLPLFARQCASGCVETRRGDGSIKPDLTDRLRPSEQIALCEIHTERFQPLELLSGSLVIVGARMIANPPKVFLTVIQKDGTLKPVDRL
jgi:hypothetical protein